MLSQRPAPEGRCDPFASRRVATIYSREQQLGMMVSTVAGAYVGLAILGVVVRHAERVGGLLERLAAPLRLFTGELTRSRDG